MSAITHTKQVVFDNLDTGTKEPVNISAASNCCWKVRFLIEEYWGEIGSLNEVLKAYFSKDQSDPAQKLLYFSQLHPSCRFFSTNSTVAKAAEFGQAMVISSKIVKFFAFEYFLSCARVMHSLPIHPHLNRFEGILYSKAKNKYGLAFEKIEGSHLGKPNLTHAITIVEVYCHLERYGIFYDDFCKINVMVTKQDNRAVVIDYDSCCRKKADDEDLWRSRNLFGNWLKSDAPFQELAERCRSLLTMTELSWTHVLLELRKLQK